MKGFRRFADARRKCDSLRHAAVWFSHHTHAAVRDLEAAGLELQHAEAIVAAVSRADEQLATKVDVAAVETGVAALRSDMVMVKADIAWLKADAAARRSEVRWMFGFQSAIILAIAARLFVLV